MGYADDDYSLHHTLPMTEFLSAENHLELLAHCNEVRGVWWHVFEEGLGGFLKGNKSKCFDNMGLIELVKSYNFQQQW